MNNPAPIALFAYNRPLHTNMCVASLLKNPQAKDTDLFVFCDGWKNSRDREKVEETRRVARDIRGFKSVTVVEAKEKPGACKLCNCRCNRCGESLRACDSCGRRPCVLAILSGIHEQRT